MVRIENVSAQSLNAQPLLIRIVIIVILLTLSLLQSVETISAIFQKIDSQLEPEWNFPSVTNRLFGIWH